MDEWSTPRKGFIVSIFSYSEEVDPKLESNLPFFESEFKPEETILIEGREGKKLVAEEDNLVLVGPIKKGKVNHFIALNSWLRKAGLEEFDLMLSTFKFLE